MHCYYTPAAAVEKERVVAENILWITCRREVKVWFAGSRKSIAVWEWVDGSSMGFGHNFSADQSGPSSKYDWAHAGMTLAMSPAFDPACHRVADLRALLDAAAEANMKLIVRDRRGDWAGLAAGEVAYRAGFAEAVSDFGDHPAVFGFHVGDEPTAETFFQACQASRLQKTIAPHLSRFLNPLPWSQGVEEQAGFERWSDYLNTFVEQAQPDLLCYPGVNPGQEAYFANLRAFHGVSERHGIPFWTMLRHLDCPSEADVRWLVNTATAHGAKGLLWFSDDLPHASGDAFEWLSQTNRTFLQWQAPVLLGLTLQRVSHVGQAWGGAPLFTGNPLLRSARSLHGVPLIVSEFTDGQGYQYLAMTNNSRTESSGVEFSIHGHARRLSRVGGQQGEQAISDRWFVTSAANRAVVRCWLAPGQMELYRVSPK